MIYVLGSINNDIYLDIERPPKKNETVIADGCRMGLGGKGANQAVAIAKLSHKKETGQPVVKLIGQVGNDAVGKGLIDKLNEFGVNTDFVRCVNRATGTTVHNITNKVTRTIMYSGANSAITKTEVDVALEGAGKRDTLLCQLDVPLYVVAYALRKARSLGMTTILNPSPAKLIPDDMYFNVDIIVLNAQETLFMTGINPQDYDAQRAAMRKLHMHGVPYVVITLGSKGVALSDGIYIVGKLPADNVNTIDREGVGDAFVGAFALTYPHIGMYSFREACIFATHVAGLTVSRRGMSESMPTIDDVYKMYSRVIV